MSEFVHTHTIKIQHSGGQTERIEVQANEGVPGAITESQPLYQRKEWEESSLDVDWSYDLGDGLCFQGNPGGPYNFAEYTIVEKAS